MKTRTAVIGTVAALTMLGGTAYAVTAATPDPVNACITKSTGQVRIVASTGQCKSNEAPLTWNVQGTPGAPGVDGADGAAGADGVSGYELVSADKFIGDFLATSGSTGVDCPAGKKVLGGGGSFITDGGANVTSSTLDITASYPENDGTGWWVAYAADPVGAGIKSVRVYATCATVN